MLFVGCLIVAILAGLATAAWYLFKFASGKYQYNIFNPASLFLMFLVGVFAIGTIEFLPPHFNIHSLHLMTWSEIEQAKLHFSATCFLIGIGVFLLNFLYAWRRTNILVASGAILVQTIAMSSVVVVVGLYLIRHRQDGMNLAHD